MKQSMAQLGVGICSLFLISTAQAQNIKSLPNVTVTATTTPVSISSKVTKAFEADFKNAVGPVWTKLNKNYLVYFISDEVANRALYRKNGYRIYNFRYGTEKHLPDDVKEVVKSSFKNYEITGTINVLQDNRDIWLVNLQDWDKLIIARVEKGKMDGVTEYFKRH